ncbi:MAG: phosphoglycerate dehydrogenase [Planctomycetota bacterium]|nr:phosphoglycerate dehydrogenase [Planctomycetota bacterium]
MKKLARMKYRILVADDLAEDGLAILRATGEVTLQKGMDENALRTALQGYHALVVRSATQVTARSLELADQLALIGRAGIGVDNIDVAAATARGIVVMNTPEAGAVTTGEHAVSLLLSMTRNIPAADASVRAGKWEKSKFTGVELQGKQIGVLGLGRIGRVVADRTRGLGMVVTAYDPFVTQQNAPHGVRMQELDELLASSDFVSVHVPLAEETRHLLSRQRLFAMKHGARLVHAARGGIVDERALCEALHAGHLAGAALDVFEQEPLPMDSPLRTAPNLVFTPHLGASTHEAKHNVSIEMAKQVALCLQKGIALNGVNVPRIAPSDAAHIGPWLTLAHNLAAFLVQAFAGTVQSLRLTAQGGIAEPAVRALAAAMAVGGLKYGNNGAVTPVNVERIAKERSVRLHHECGILKRDFLNLIRIEAVIDDVRHFTTGTVFGNRHGRLVEVDDYLLDAIPEPPLLLTVHSDQPGVVGMVGTLLGENGINITRMQLGIASHLDAMPPSTSALALINLDRAVEPSVLQRLRALAPILRATQIL